VVNLVAQGAPDKRDAIPLLMSRLACDRAFDVGDDVNDEPVFAGAPADRATAKVGAPSTTQARFVLDDRGLVGAAVRRIPGGIKSCGVHGPHISASGV